VRQYDIHWANLPAPVGRRPVLLLTRTPAFGYLSKVIVTEVTTTIRGIPQEVPLSKTEGLPQPSVANLDNVHVIPIRVVAERIGRLGAGRDREIKRALGYALDWPELKIL
jgi:mRNA interferase MazF